MSYIYTTNDRLKDPCDYMYTPFEGDALLYSYFSGRNISIDSFDSIQVQMCEISLDDVFVVMVAKKVKLPVDKCIGDIETNLDISKELQKIKSSLPKFSANYPIYTNDLLCSLIVNQVADSRGALTKKWLGRLVQRFEVTKKIYKSYKVGFRNGVDTNLDLRLYWLLGMSLSLAYVCSKNTQYLSTLLKLSDLLCSISGRHRYRKIPTQGMKIILEIEKMSVQELVERNIGPGCVFE